MQPSTRGNGWLVGALCALLAAGCSSPADESETTAPVAPGEAAAPAPAAVAEAVGELFVDPEAEPDEGAPPLSVQFSANVEDNQGPYECDWDFGDGSPKRKGDRPMHVYSKVADYEILVTCKDSTGLTGEGEVDVFVEDDDAPPPSYAPTPQRPRRQP